jgi:outer membrane scaffolding protein for murein synthesis (MipA/OmpV family)
VNATAAAALVLGLSLPSLAWAELSDDSLLGPGLRSRPAYDGSASQHGEIVPVLRYLGQPGFVRSTQGLLEGGLRYELAPRLHVAAQVAYEPGRKSSESDFLASRGIGSVGPGASVGAQIEWDQLFGPMPVTVLLRGRQHVDTDRGAQADLRVSAGAFHAGRFSAGVFIQSIWATAKSVGSIYDVTPAQATSSGLSAYRAGAGWLSASLGVLWSVDLSRDWIVVGSVESRHLHGDAARSPLAERATNHTATAGLAYRF